MDREKNARRKAQRQELILRKSRIDGTWSVIDPGFSWGIIGGSRNSRGDQGLSLEDVEEFLKQSDQTSDDTVEPDIGSK